MRVILELLRIVLIFFILGGIFGALLAEAYEYIGVIISEEYGWMGFIAIFLSLFVLYRNKLQFSGWYTGTGNKKLSQKTTVLLLSFSAAMIILLPIVSLIKN